MNNIGYSGIGNQGNGGLIENNSISNWLYTLNDGAAITFDNCTDLEVRNNVVHAPFFSTDPEAVLSDRLESVSLVYTERTDITFGIYFGNRPAIGVVVENNVVYGCAAGIHVDHTTTSANNIIRNNTLFNNDIQLNLLDHSNCMVLPGNDPCLGVPVGPGTPYQGQYDTEYEGNILYCLNSAQVCMQQGHTYAGSHATLVNYGTFSNNYYFNPFTDIAVLQRLFYPVTGVTEYLGGSVIPHTLAGWQNPPATAPRDLGSTRSPLRLKDFDAFGFTAIPNDGLSADMSGGDLSGWGAGTYTSPVCNDCEQGGYALSAVDQNWIERNGSVMWTNGPGTQGTPVIEPGKYHFNFRMRSPDTDAIRFGPVFQYPSYRQYQYLGLSPEWRTYEMVFDVADLGGNDYMVSAFQNVQYSLGLLGNSVVELDFIEAKACTLNTDYAQDVIAEEHILRYHCPLTAIAGQNAGPSFTIPGDPGQCWSDVYGNFYAAGDTYELDEWESVVLFRMDVDAPPFGANDHGVSVDELWTENWNIAGRVEIYDGVTLTIDGAQIGFAENANITVQPGATLVLKNGATLRNWMGCDGPAAMWDGVKVLGTGTTTGAGLVVMESGARITNALTAIRCAEGSVNTIFGGNVGSGGIIQANNAVFENNFLDVVTRPHTVVDPAVWGPSSFTNCTFKRTRELHDTQLPPGGRVNLMGSASTPFLSCTFQNTTGDHSGMGIHAIDTRIKVEGGDEPAARSRFQGLDFAILHSAFSPITLAVVDRCDFTDNKRGLLIAGADNSIVTRCTFTVADEAVTELGVEGAYGAYLFGCSGFEVEENTFTGTGTEHPKVGLVVRNTGIADNMFYNNTFSGFADASERSAGTIIMGANATADYSTGLRIKCNDYDPEATNDYDVAFTGNVVSLAGEQGAPSPNAAAPAGNTFALVDPLTCNGNEARHLYEDVEGALNAFSYWHHDPNSDPSVELEPHCSDGVPVDVQSTEWFYSKQNACPVDLSGMVVIEDDEVVVVNADTELEVLVQVYTNWKDGGNTEGLVEFVQDPANSSYAIRNQLMLVAPKVSYEAWRECFGRTPAMNPWHLAQALLANSPLEPAVLRILAESDIDPFYRELVENGQNGGVSMHSIYKSEIAHFQGVLSQAQQAMVRKSLLSGDGGDLALTLQTMDQHPAKGMAQGALALHLAGGDLAAARDVVDDRLQAQQDDHDLWVVYDLLVGLYEDSKGPLDLDAAGAAVLETIARDGRIGAAQAEAWLALLGEPIEEVVWLPNQNKRLKPQREPKASTARPLLGAYPNPSNGPVYFTFPVAEGVEQVELRLHDASGRLIGNHILAPKAGILELQHRDLPSGIVLANLYWDGIRVADAKVALVR